MICIHKRIKKRPESHAIFGRLNYFIRILKTTREYNIGLLF